MKKLFPAILFIIFSAPIFQGCLKDSCQRTYTLRFPVYKKLSELRREMKAVAPKPLASTGKIYTYGRYLFINEAGKGIHVIDNAQPAQPRNLSFINIPGTVDMAVKGSYLYADSYGDIVVFNISDPAAIGAPRFVDNAIKEFSFWGGQTNPDSVMVIADYILKDTTVSCETFERWTGCPMCSGTGGVVPAVGAASSTGTGGSMARFAIVNDYLYGLSSMSLYSFSLSDPSLPRAAGIKGISRGRLETIYPFGQNLFIGSTTGMFIYDLANPSNPTFRGDFNHANACDPVITDGQHAYVTLRAGNLCQTNTNELDVLDVSNLSQPSLVKVYPMGNPHGLSKDGSTLFICDGDSGLKIYNASNPSSHKLLKTFGQMNAYDIIAGNGLAIVVAKDGLYQYDYSNLSNIRLLSKMSISK